MKKIFSYSFALFIALSALAGFFSPNLAEAAVITSTANGGVWNVGSTWVGGKAPANADVVIIATTNGNSVTMGGNRATTGLTVNAGAVLNFDGAYTLTQNGNLLINGSIIGPTGIIKMNVSGLAFDGGGSVGSSILVSQNFSFPATANLTINNNINSAGRTVTNNGIVNLNGNYFRTGGTAIWTQGMNALLNISGAFTPSANVTLNASAAGNTINYYGGAQVVEPATYANLILSGSGAKTIALVTVNGNLTLSGTASATTAMAMTIGGNLDVGAGTVFATGATNTWTLTVSGTTSVSGTLTLANTGNKTFTGAVTLNSGGIWNETGAAAVTFNNSLTNNATTFTANTGTHTFGGSSTKTISGSTATVIPGTVIFGGGAYVNNGTLSAVTMSSLLAGSSLTNNGTVSVSTALSGPGSFIQGGTGTLNFSGSTIAITTFNAGAAGNTVNYSGAAQTIRAATYSNLAFSGSNNKTTPAGTTVVGGNWDIGAGTTALLSTNNSSLTVAGDITGGGAITSGTGTITVGGNWTNSGIFTKDSGTVIYNGGSSQTVGALTYNNLTINKSGGTSILGGSGTRVDGVLSLNGGNIVTGADDIYISSTGSVSRTSGHIVGNLRKYIPAGPASRTFEVGDVSNYTPADLAFGNVAVAGDLTVKTTASDHPAVGSSDIDPAMTANRHWTLTNSVSSPVSFNNYGATFHFINPGDLDAGADPLNFSVGQYAGSAWSYPAVGAKLSASTEATGMTALGDFQLGAKKNPAPITTSISPDTKVSGEAQFVMTVNGSNFISGAIVKFAGSPRSTTYVSANQLTAVIPGSDLVTVGDYDITVANPAPATLESNAQIFHVINQAPFITSISPSYRTIGDAQFEMTVNGSNFLPSSVLNFNSSPRLTTYMNANQLIAVIPAGDMAAATSSALITVTNPAPGGGTSNAKVFAVYNPTPVLSSISPDSKAVGDAQFDMTVTGTNFMNGAMVRFNGSSRTTTYVSATQLTATIPDTDLTTATTSALITVANPAPTLSGSNAMALAVNPVGNPLPVVTSISPASKVAGDPAFTLTVNGSNFIASSVVRFGGTDEPTTYVSPTRLTAEIPAADISSEGNYNVRVFNPLPGGGLSDPQLFTVTAVPPTVAVKFSVTSADSSTVGSPVIVTVRALKSDNSIDTNFNNGVTLVSTGSATGAGLLNLISGIATVGINDSVAETVRLSLSDTQRTGLDISSFKDISFVTAPVSGPGGGSSVRPTTLTISGRAFPGASISLVEKKSGQASVSSQNIDISRKGDFTITVSGIIQGEYTYNLLVRDKDGRSSQTKTYNVNFVSESLFERDILIPPTISLAQSIIKKGDQLKVSGYSYPGTKVTLNLDEISYETTANASGVYGFSINTTLLGVGSHFARVSGTDAVTKQETGWSTAQSFQISQTPAMTADIDLDKNGIIDVRDWSIFLNRFSSRSADVIRTIDFNNDGRADAADLSIFLANYTAAIR